MITGIVTSTRAAMIPLTVYRLGGGEHVTATAIWRFSASDIWRGQRSSVSANLSNGGP